MAKIVYPTRRRKQSSDAFELTGNLFSESPFGDAAGDLEHDIHPSIRDFVVNVRRREQSRAAGVESSIEVDRSVLRPTDALTFITFGSGSSGNCAYLGTPSGGILIDAGVDADTVTRGLRDHGINPKAVKGIILTHDHSDHVKYVYSMVRKRPEMGIYCTPKTLGGLLRRHSISRRIKDYHKPIYKEFAFQLGPFEITPFDVSHDGTDNVGYFITCGGHSMAIATDLGCITPRVDFYMRQANHIVIESNYDAAMLASGPYPMHLRARIAADHGHLENSVTAAFLASIAGSRLRHVFLCHLSHDNNLPDLALEASRKALAAAGITRITDGTAPAQAADGALTLVALPRTEISPLFTLR